MNLAVRPPTYVSKRKPWAHQKRALDKMYRRVAYALLMAMRTGKTKTLLDDWGGLEAEDLVDDLLVIAPAGVYRTWEVAIKDHLATDLLARTDVCTWSANMSKKDRDNLLKFMTTAIKKGKPRILLVNLEALSNVERARELCVKFTSQRRTMVAIDESTGIKNYKAKRTKFCNKQLKPLAEFRRILTGLVAPKSPLDLYPQFEFLDNKILGYSNPISFRARYAVMKKIPTAGRWVDIVVGYRDVDQLYELIEPHSSRVKLEDCYDLPPKIYTTREVRMTAEQERIYRQLKEFATAELEGNRHVSAQQVITQILRMHQVLCGHTTDENGRHVEIPETRTDELLDLLGEYDGQKAIIWCSYDHDVRKVSLALERMANPERRFIDENSLTTVARFWGGNRADREREEQEFLTNPECRFMVATAAAGGRGRTWTAADLVVYYSNTADLEHRAQSEERAQGVDKVNSVLYVDLVVPGTVDMKMLQTLRKKINMSGAITNDGWRNWVI